MVRIPLRSIGAVCLLFCISGASAQPPSVKQACLFGRRHQAPATDPVLLALLQQIASQQQQILAMLQAQQARGIPAPAYPPVIVLGPQGPYQTLPVDPRPRQELPVDPRPRQELPVDPRPRQDVPVEPRPRQDVPVIPRPRQELPIGPQPRQELPGPGGPAPSGFQRFTVQTALWRK